METGVWYDHPCSRSPEFPAFNLDLWGGSSHFTLERVHLPIEWRVYLRSCNLPDAPFSLLVGKFANMDVDAAKTKAQGLILKFVRDELEKLEAAFFKTEKNPSVWDRLQVEGEGLHLTGPQSL